MRTGRGYRKVVKFFSEAGTEAQRTVPEIGLDVIYHASAFVKKHAA